MARRDWTDEERYAALKLYFELEFGQFHKGNRSVIALAGIIGRTPSAVAMKLGNFASLDPTLDRKGFTGVSAADRALMLRFHNHPERVVDEIERAVDRISLPSITEASIISAQLSDISDSTAEMSDHAANFDVSGRPTVGFRTARVRLNQSFFRKAVLSGYRFQCCVCGLGLHRLLDASHIKPHNEDETYRLRPDNGLSLCRNHHKAFDEGYWALDGRLRLEVDQKVRKLAQADETIGELLLRFDGEQIRAPFRYMPSTHAIEWHRENVFGKSEPIFGSKQPV
ncbi:HNH endonuclease [Thalassospira alkalitolerans]|uniref:HNH endonuclease n=1 Tax=Thalassospira alkalitolerans TaxID=1293890 RepID=UPI00146E28CE|nr:HNH endonuclease [Thalassospira alkalitolerans]